MTKDEARAILQAGGSMQYSRASLGSSACAHINGERLRIDVARSLLTELSLQSDKPYGVTKTYRMPPASTEAQSEASSTHASKGPQL